MPLGLSAGAVAAIGAGASAAGSVASGLINSSSAAAGAKQQQAATNESLAQQQAQFNYNQGLELPFVQNGQDAQTVQNALIGDYGTQVTPYLNQLANLGNGATAQATLEQTPGYQWTLQQGLASTQNAAAARGLGVSGAALKGAATYATGLADNTYQQQYSDASNNLTQAQNTFGGLNNALAGEASLGENAAVGAGNQGQAASNNTSNLLTGNGNSQAASTIAQGNALSGGIANVGSSVTNYGQSLQLQNYLAGNGSMYGSNTNTLSGLDNAVQS